MQADYINFKKFSITQNADRLYQLKPGFFIFTLLFAIAMMFCSPLRCAKVLVVLFVCGA